MPATPVRLIDGLKPLLEIRDETHRGRVGSRTEAQDIRTPAWLTAEFTARPGCAGTSHGRPKWSARAGPHRPAENYNPNLNGGL